MRKTKRFTIMVLSALTVLMTLTACGINNAEKSASESLSTSDTSNSSSIESAESSSQSTSSQVASSEAKVANVSEDGLLIPKKTGYHIAEVRYQTPDGKPIAMEIKHTNFTGDNQIFSNLDSAKQAGVLDVIEKGGAYVYTIKVGAAINWVFTPVKDTAPAGFDDTKKEIPVALNAEPTDDGTYSVYTITCDYTPSLVQPTFDKADK